MNLFDDQKAMKAQFQEKKPYSKPQVQIYGDLREITQVVGKNGNDDFAPGGGPSSKTSV